MLDQAGDLIDHLSWHLYQPDREGWYESYDMEALRHTICAAPLDVEHTIVRIANQIRRYAPTRQIGIAFDEWNLWLPPETDASSMHQIGYTQRDALYAAGMLNGFQRQCNILSMANLAQLVNVLPLIDMSATRDDDGSQLTLGLINRHPTRAVHVAIELAGFTDLRPRTAWLLHSDDPLATNSAEQPGNVQAREVDAPNLRRGKLQVELPASALWVGEYELR
jgi:alpha-L-arabinofuranosidase